VHYITFGITVVDFALFQSVQIGCGMHLASYSVGRLFFFRGKGASAKSWLRMSGAIPHLPLYAFLEWRGTILSVPLPFM
jgi:hypothetical protein